MWDNLTGMGTAVLGGYSRRWRGRSRGRGGNMEVPQGAPPSHTKRCPQNAPYSPHPPPLVPPFRTHSGFFFFFFTRSHTHTHAHTWRGEETGQTVYKTHLVANAHSFKQNWVRNWGLWVGSGNQQKETTHPIQTTSRVKQRGALAQLRTQQLFL